MNRKLAPALIAIPACVLVCAWLVASDKIVETILSQCSAGSDTIQIVLRTTPEGQPSFAISAGNASSRQSFNLHTPCPPKLNPILPAVLKIDAADPANSNNLVATFAMTSAESDTTWVSVWLNKTAGRWTLRGEWIVETDHQELGEKSEAQTFVFNAGGTLKRCAARNNIEGIKTTCPAGCCVTWQSKTLTTEEVETLAWNDALDTAERKSFQKWYVTQYGDGAFSIAQKIFGNPARISTLYRLNPEIQNRSSSKTAKILIEKVGG